MTTEALSIEQPQHPLLERVLHDLFEFGLSLKVFNGIWEIVSGIFVLWIGTPMFHRVFGFLLRGELLEHPRDALTRYLASFVHIPHGTRVFAAVYILLHGVLNIFLAYQLFRNRLWAYVVTMSLSVLFMVYQIHRITLYHSRVLMVVTVLDVFFLALTAHEYYHQRKRLLAGV